MHVALRAAPAAWRRGPGLHADPWYDALHPAVACVHEVDFLLTWNIRHLANPNQLDHLVAVNRRLGLLTPRIVTPEILWLE